jgi:2-dehydropantoate 2-reductase
MYPHAQVLDGCVYVNARKAAPGIIHKTSSIAKIQFGSTTAPQDKLNDLQKVFIDAGIDSHLSNDIETDIWTKFVFTAGMATSTSYFNEPIGEVLSNVAHRSVLTSLVQEAYSVAKALRIKLPDNCTAATIEKMEQFPPESTSSMHRDFQQGGNTEYRSLTQYVADLGDKTGVNTPTYDMILPQFLAYALRASN